MKEASYYKSIGENKVRCELCPHYCTILPGNSGICLVRKNVNGKLMSEVYGRPVSIHSDPVEKKPLYHFYPGYQVLSIGTFGCNLKCEFCQNWEISQKHISDDSLGDERSLDEIIDLAMLKQRNIGLAYTYNEPVVFYEYMLDLAGIIKSRGMKNIMVSNGYINPEPLGELLKLIDAFNIDLKSISNEFYKKYTKSSVNPVLETISAIAKSGKHLELTFLVIPGLNDDFEEFISMIDWIVNHCGNSVVLHISRYFPAYKMNIAPTPLKLLENLYSIAKRKLPYVYLGNVRDSDGQDTFCPACKKLMVSRSGYYSTVEGLDSTGRCKYCGELIIKYLSV